MVDQLVLLPHGHSSTLAQPTTENYTQTMALEIRDQDTIALVNLLASHTGTTADEAIAHAVDGALNALQVEHGSYRERRNARVRARSFESHKPFGATDATPASSQD